MEPDDAFPTRFVDSPTMGPLIIVHDKYHGGAVLRSLKSDDHGLSEEQIRENSAWLKEALKDVYPRKRA